MITLHTLYHLPSDIQAADAHVGSVKEFYAILKPTPPSPPVDLASDLAEYESSEPTLAGVSATGILAAAAASAEEGGSTPQEFLAFLEADLPKEDVHHH
jgi:F-type H+-transporting ATPase subunit h